MLLPSNMDFSSDLLGRRPKVPSGPGVEFDTRILECKEYSGRSLPQNNDSINLLFRFDEMYCDIIIACLSMSDIMC